MIGYGDSRGSPNLGWGAGTPYRETLGCKFGHCVRVHVDIYRRAKFHLTCSIGCGDSTGPKKSRQNPELVQNMRQRISAVPWRTSAGFSLCVRAIIPMKPDSFLLSKFDSVSAPHWIKWWWVDKKKTKNWRFFGPHTHPLNFLKIAPHHFRTMTHCRHRAKFGKDRLSAARVIEADK